MMLTDLATVLRAAGLKVIEVNGWRTRGRPGGMIAVHTITTHHTANGGAKGNAPSLNVVTHGRSDLAGPLAQLLLAKDGTWYVIAAGKCNHAGLSRSTSYTNSYAIGIEAEAEGVPGAVGDWPEVQMDSYAVGCQALRKHYGLKVADVRGHKETCAPEGRKTDPDFDMPAFRVRVAAVGLPIRAAVEEDDMPYTKAEIADAVWNSDRIPVNDPTTGKPANPTNPTWQADSVLGEILAQGQRAAKAAADQLTATKQLTDAVKALVALHTPPIAP